MSMDLLLRTIRTFDGVLELAPGEGDAYPEIAWGDHFFYYAPSGEVPQHGQPYATVVTKNYPGDSLCGLDHPGRRRLNIHVGRAAFADLTGEDPRADPAPRDYTATDVVLPHPVHRAGGWIAVINPAATTPLASRLLLEAHGKARARAERRGGPTPGARGY